MSEYEGLVATLKEDGKAEVVIKPKTAGIPGAPELNDLVCHSTTDGSTITVEALNRAGARVGDVVSISRNPRALMKNAATLLGIPAVGLISGVVVAVILNQRFVVHATGTVIVATAGLLLGIIIAAVIYRGGSSDKPVITRIIKTSIRTPACLTGHQSGLQNEGGVKMEIKVLGPGCPRCHQTEKNVKDAVAETGVEAIVEHVSDVMEIAKYGVFGTPAVVVNGEVKSVGKIPEKEEVKGWLSKAPSTFEGGK